MDQNMAECSHASDLRANPETSKENNEEGKSSNAKSDSACFEAPESFILNASLADTFQNSIQSSMPLLIRPSFQSAIICQPRALPMRNQPHSLFVQALTKLNDGSHRVNLINQFKSDLATSKSENQTTNPEPNYTMTPPESLMSAPPSYSFVLQQMAARRRPRLMGTFIPSPSFVTHAPPPTYATAFDIYVDNPVAPPPRRVYHFGFTPMMAICQECGFAGMTMVISKVTLCTHLCAFFLCLFCCWICAPLPYVLRSCKDVYHYCQNCRSFLGLYCPSNPERNYR